MVRIECVVAFIAALSACQNKSCPTQPVESFVGSSPRPELATALSDLGSHNKVCGTAGKGTVVMTGSRSSAMDALDAALEGAGFHEVPGRGRTEGDTVFVSYFKAKDDKNGDLVEFALSTGDVCAFGDVCIENQGYSVAPR